MKAIACICCESIIRDAETNAISLINVIDEIVSQGAPIFLPRFAIFLLSEKEESDTGSNALQMTISVDAIELMRVDLAVNFETEQTGRRNRTNIRVGGLLVPNGGDLSIRFLASGKIYAEQTLPVRVIPMAQITPTPPPLPVGAA